MKFDGVIFDLDGTLLDSLEGIADAMNILLTQLKYPTHPVEAYKYFVGEGINELLKLALPKEKQNVHDMEQLVKDYRAIYDKTWSQKSFPYQGIPEMLDVLSTQKIKLSVLSNKSDEFVRRMTSVLLPKWKFEVVKGSRAGEPLKPDPTPALEIAAITGIDPANIIFLGDSGIDMATAARAGMYGVGVLWGFRPAEELLASGAKQLIKHPGELLDIINNN
ncbi:MAG: HAD family hydrolase [Acidobacteria bacterium]|jgi:phosphoglycolate phosphatase|nr:HAD family hydrolase [Acidobacteriota bacterium]